MAKNFEDDDDDNTPPVVLRPEIKAAINAAGLVPVKVRISEAGLGLRKGEIRGVVPETAQLMIDARHADLHKVAKEAPAKAGEIQV